MPREAGLSAIRPDELEVLSPEWRELVAALREDLKRLIRERDELTASLQRATAEFAERQLELEALRRARASAESLSLVRGQILAMVSRSMRGPADALLGLSGLLRIGALLPTQRGYVDGLHKSGEALRGILNEVSDFSRLESGTLPLEPIRFDLRVMTEDVVTALRAEAEGCGVALRLVWEGLQENPAWRVQADPGRVRQILTAILRDSLSRLSQGGCISLTMARTTGGALGLRAVVEDSGPPIPADLLPTTFEPFLRADATPGRGGSELGLPIARQLARLMGGELQVETVGPPGAEGSRFQLRLPLPASVDGPASRSSSPTATAGGTILVVEHDAGQRAAWTCVAEAAGYLAIGASDPARAHEELKRLALAGRFASIVLFSDHDAEGYEQIGRAISEDGALGRPALVMLPAAGNPGDARRLQTAGFRGYLVKPIVPADLREVLETIRRTPREQHHALFVTRHSILEARG